MKKNRVNPFGNIDDILGIDKPNPAVKEKAPDPILPEEIEKTPTPPDELLIQMVNKQKESELGRVEQEIIPMPSKPAHPMYIRSSSDEHPMYPLSASDVTSDVHPMNIGMNNGANIGMKSEVIVAKTKPNDAKVKSNSKSEKKTFSYIKLTFHQTKMLSIIIKRILETNESRIIDGFEYAISSPIMGKDFEADVPIISTQKSIKQRFKELFEMVNVEAQPGTNGYAVYGIKKTIFPDVVELSSRSLMELKHGANGMRVGRSNGMISSDEVPLVSKLVNNTKLTTLEEPKFNVAAINIEPIQKFGITRKQIQDIYNQKLEFTDSTLQEFVDRFTIYASDPKNIRNVNSVAAIFVKMAQLSAKGCDPLQDIETDCDRAINDRIEALKRKKLEKDRQVAELVELEFENWYGSFKADEILELVPEVKMVNNKDVRLNLVRQHFINNIWRGI